MLEENKAVPIISTPPAAPLAPNTKQPPEKRMTKERQKLERDTIRINSHSSIKSGGGPSNPSKDQV